MAIEGQKPSVYSFKQQQCSTLGFPRHFSYYEHRWPWQPLPLPHCQRTASQADNMPAETTIAYNVKATPEKCNGKCSNLKQKKVSCLLQSGLSLFHSSLPFFSIPHGTYFFANCSYIPWMGNTAIPNVFLLLIRKRFIQLYYLQVYFSFPLIPHIYKSRGLPEYYLLNTSLTVPSILYTFQNDLLTTPTI